MKDWTQTFGELRDQSNGNLKVRIWKIYETTEEKQLTTHMTSTLNGQPTAKRQGAPEK
jgi:hypothetical protein